MDSNQIEQMINAERLREPAGLGRRALLTGSLALLAAAGGADRVWAGVLAREPGAFDAAQMRFLDAYAETLIPATDTASAKDVGAPKFVAILMRRSLTAAELDQFGTKLKRIEVALDVRVGKRFVNADPAARFRALDALDRETLTRPRDEKVSPELDFHDAYLQLKTQIAAAYYTSEEGATKELRYEPVPGRYDPDVPLEPDARNFSNGE